MLIVNLVCHGGGGGGGSVMMGKVMYMPDELFLFSMYVGENVVL